VFLKRKKLALEKFLMGWFVLFTSSVASFFVASEMLTSRSPITIILIAWNILMSVLILIQMGAHEFDISDENASFGEVFVTTVILFVILLFADLYLRLSWSMTLSMCFSYSSSIVFITTFVTNYFDLQIPNIQK